MDRDELASRLAGVDWAGALAVGVVTFLVGYVVTVVIVVAGPSVVEADLGTFLVVVGFVFYNAHSVPYGTGDGWLADLLASPAAGQGVPPVVFYAVPMVLLLAAGVVVALRVADRELDPIELTLGVVGFTVGYAGIAVLGTFVFRLPTQQGLTAAPILEFAALFGVAYPLVFGTIGAGVAAILTYARRRG